MVYVLANPYWAMGGGGVSAVNVPLINSFDFKVNSTNSSVSQAVPTSSATVFLYKNGTNDLYNASL
jgi:hypothetical protein